MQTEESHVTTETGDTSTRQGEQAELRQSMEQTLPQSLQKSQSCQHVDLDFWFPEPQNSTFLLFYITQFVVIS